MPYARGGSPPARRSSYSSGGWRSTSASITSAASLPCTAGLLLALKVSGIGPGDEVLVPTLTFVSCANVVEHLGARPVFVDCEPDSGLIDLDAAERLIGPATRAVIAVHLAGRPLDMDR